jgi:chromosome segregation ATPase
MPATIDPVLGVLVAAFISALGAYLIAARRFSGKIGSSDAAELWLESRSIRDWSSARILELNQLVGKLEGRVDVVEEQNTSLGRENTDLMQRITDLSATITELRAEIVALTSELKQSRERVSELEDEASG